MESLATEFAKYLGLNPSVKRMDSLMVSSSNNKRIYTCFAQTNNVLENTEDQSAPKKSERYLEKISTALLKKTPDELQADFGVKAKMKRNLSAGRPQPYKSKYSEKTKSYASLSSGKLVRAISCVNGAEPVYRINPLCLVSLKKSRGLNQSRKYRLRNTRY